MAGITWDDSSFQEGVRLLQAKINAGAKKAVSDIAAEVLRLSQMEVPHDVGTLQNSGAVEPGTDEFEQIVGYNTVYAAYQHEGHRADGSHVITHYQGGRKGKYLEDPIRNNLDTFKSYFDGILN